VALTASDPRGTTGAVSDAPARPPTPQEAAAIILTRDGPAGLEALLLQRHPKSRFSPGAFAFPGGRLEAVDSAPGVVARCRGLGRTEAARRLRDVQPPERAVGIWVAALRELFEEAGMLLAYGPDEWPVSAAFLEGVRAQRTRCREDSAAFGRLLVERDLTLATDRVAYWAHWITPEERPIRYDTRFFVAAAWADQVVEPDGLEMVAAQWIRPDDALVRHEARELVLPFRLSGSSRPSPSMATSRPSWRRPADATSDRSARESSATRAASASSSRRIPTGSETGRRRRVG
jgi:8-oxo-dGTP pyrophosphatase MutT (NUDIX family)